MAGMCMCACSQSAVVDIFRIAHAYKHINTHTRRRKIILNGFFPPFLKYKKQEKLPAHVYTRMRGCVHVCVFVCICCDIV